MNFYAYENFCNYSMTNTQETRTWFAGTDGFTPPDNHQAAKMWSQKPSLYDQRTQFFLHTILGGVPFVPILVSECKPRLEYTLVL